jgi:NDP-sugar pyrophosphorylase family protein
VVDRDAFAAIPAGHVVNSIGGCYDALIAHTPGSIRGVVTDAHFWDIGTVADYWDTSWAWSPSQAHTSPTTRIAASATVTRSIFWDDVVVGESAVLEECIVTDGVRVTPGTHYQRKILTRAADGTTTAQPLEIN